MRPGTGRRPAILRTVAIIVVTLALGLLLGRASVPSRPPLDVGRASLDSTGGARSESGVRLGFPKTPSGAAAALAAYQQAFAGSAILRPGVLRARVDAVATPDYAARMLAANGPGAQRLAAGPIGVGLADGVRTIYRAVPIGYKVLSFSDGDAELLTWGLTIVGNLGSVEPTVWFGTSHTRLTWETGRWRIADVESGFGPTPAPGTRADAAGAYELVELARGLKGYELAP